ncbi:MAG: hypothetical protein HBSAPP04_00260 [Ignavibacteriaceae bacterium]|nr:MAG: hypothetical protein HBSAPP04_00260 [Ignavibacteriaceae bacterium]
MISALGIDLGTTFCCVSYVDDDGVAQVIPNADEELTTPSVIWYSSEEIFVGKRAVDAKKNVPSSSIEYIKRSIGMNSGISYNIWGDNYSPEELSALLLYKLVRDANNWLQANKLSDQDIKNVVITVPANFNDNQRNATKLAGELAGLNVLNIINEPTAAAIAHGVSFSSGTNFLVFDLGGGTFDLTLMHVNNPESLDVIASDGHMQLGGKNWDENLCRFLEEELEFEHDIPKASLKTTDRLRLMDHAKRVKMELTEKEESPLSFTIGGKPIKMSITREMFERRSTQLMNMLDIPFQSIEKSIGENGHISTLQRVDKLVLVGGSSRMPMVQRMALEKFNSSKVMMGEFDFAIAKGAALSASKVFKVTDVTPKSLGVLVNENGKEKVHVMIEKDKKLPVTVEKEFIANPGAVISVRQGNIGKEGDDLAVSNFMKIGEFKLDVRERTNVHVAYSFNENGILTISYWGDGISRRDMKINSFALDMGDDNFQSSKIKLKKLIEALQF